MYKKDRETLFKKIEESLVKDGFFIGEFFSTKQIDYVSGGPKDLELLYTVEDFADSFPSCMIHKLEECNVELNEGKGHQGESQRYQSNYSKEIVDKITTD